MQPHPYRNLHWYPHTSSKNIWPKISAAYFTKWFQSIFTVGRWRMYPFNLPLLDPAYIPTQSCKGASFWSLNPARAQTRLEPDIYFCSLIYAWKPNLLRELRYAQPGAELGGARGATAPPKFCLAPPVAPPKFLRSFFESPTQTIDSSPCCKTGPSSGPPKWKCLAPPLCATAE